MTRACGLSALALALAACSFQPLDLEGRPCPCVEGYRCVDDRCVPIGDAGRLPDGGSPSPCDPACHPTAEQCVDDTCVLREYEEGQRGAPTKAVVLPPSVRGEHDINLDFDDLPDPIRGEDWSRVDRLLVPGDWYRSCSFHNLPRRTADQPPLVITNVDGQVRCGSISLSGGSRWVLTGRYDQASGTGDAGFLGHADGYAGSAGTYGIMIDPRVATDPESAGKLWVDEIGERHREIEIEFVELATSTNRDAFFYRTYVEDSEPTWNVSLHDCYFHDLVAGGLFIGVPRMPTPIEGFAFYRNRVLRADLCSDFPRMGRRSIVRQNVFALCGMESRDTMAARAAGIQVSLLTGGLRIEENLVVGTPGSAIDVQDYTTPETAGPVWVANNVFADTGANWVVLGSNLGSGDMSGLEFAFDGNRFRRRVPEARLAGAEVHPYVFWLHTRAPVAIARTTWDDDAEQTEDLVSPTLDNVTLVGSENAAATLDPLVFGDFLPDAAGDGYIEIRRWNAATSFAAGDVVVMGDGSVHAALRATTGERPGEVADAWMLLGTPSDDVTLDASSPYYGAGVR